MCGSSDLSTVSQDSTSCSQKPAKSGSQKTQRISLLRWLLLASCLLNIWWLFFTLSSSVPRLSSWFRGSANVLAREAKPFARNVSNLPPVNVSNLKCPPWSRYSNHNLLSWLEAEGILYSAITKSGSSTIRVMLRKLANGSDPEESFSHKGKTRQILPPGRKIFFTFVRDPIDRFLSSYTEVWRRGNFWFAVKPSKKVIYTLPSTAFKVEAMAMFIDRLVRDGFWDVHLSLQSVKMTNKFLHSCLPFDFVGRLENFERDISHVFAMAETNPESWRERYIHHRKTEEEEKEKLREVFWNQTRERVNIICRVYSLDFINLGYPYPGVCENVNVTDEEYKRFILRSEKAKHDHWLMLKRNETKRANPS